jgi:hypothetical protein
MLVIKRIALLKRKPGISCEAFVERWLEEHTKRTGVRRRGEEEMFSF